MRRSYLLQAISGELSEWQHLARTPATHPETLFVVLLRLAGTLRGFSGGRTPNPLPNYEHERLSETLRSLEAQISAMLTEMGGGGPGYWTDTLKPDARNPANAPTIYWTAEIPKGCGPAPRDLRFSDWVWREREVRNRRHALHRKNGRPLELSRAAVNDSIPGLDLVSKPSTPPGAPALVGREYFALGEWELWDEVIRSGQIFAFVPPGIPNPKMDLVAVFRQR
jgi:predicted component of type VI protein secretion system